MYRDSAFAHGVDQWGYCRTRNSSMHQNRLDGIAHAGTLGFSIDGNIDRHLHIGANVNDEVAVAGPGLDDGNLGSGHDGVDEPGTAARNEQVDVSSGSHKFIGDLVAALDELHRLTNLVRQPGSHRRNHCPVGL